MQKNVFSKRNWLILVLFGLIGQIAWSVENMYFNLFVFETISPDLDTVTLMVQLSGIAATVTTLIAGTLSDKTGNRRGYISYGYLIWGLTVALFGFLSVENIQAILQTNSAKAIGITLTAVVVGDCVMTLFGSTANDAAFNAWVTDNTHEEYRGKVEGVLSVLPLIAMLIVAGGFGILVEIVGYQGLFLGLGAVITLCGVAGIFIIKDSPALEKKGTLKDIIYGFKPSVIKNNPPFYLTLFIVGVYGIACQIFMPYLIIYMKTYLHFTTVEYSVVFGLAIVLGAVLNVWLGGITDKLDKTKLLYLAAAILTVGLAGMYFMHFENKMLTLVTFGIFGFVMITGYILVSALCGALTRDYTPPKDAGKLQGVRMIFSVLIPMLLGPMIGNAINKAANIPLPDLGSADVMTTQYIPAPAIFLAGAIVAALMFALIPVLGSSVKKAKADKNKKNFIRLKTDYEIEEIPHSEHPMPQMMRESWLCLNGEWDFYKTTVNGEKCNEGKILVPFSPETLNSGIAEDFLLKSGEKLTYQRKVTLDKTLLKGVTKLHFGAVDSECKVYCNGELVGEHVGGFTAFSCDISKVAREGENELTVECWDEGTRNHGARGKQSDKRGGIWYTPQSGIWQTVWLESMPSIHVENLKITPDFLTKTVKMMANGCDSMQIVVFDNGKEILRKNFEKEVILQYDFELWSPENPKLYDFEITTASGDKVQSYFGVRSFGQTKDKNGIARLTLNGKPYFFNGVLDQGYWSDGMLTYPSDKAAIEELQMLKNMGFNTVRKHIKLEPMRWYYHCDRLGLIVWQDFVSGGGEYKFTHVAAFPFLGFKHRDDDYKYFARENERGRVEFKQMTNEILDSLYNCVCIGVWVPFNEGWGQFDSAQMTKYVQSKDSTRIIDSVSGWHDQGVGKTELLSLHTYYTPLRIPKDERPVVLSEFGGYSMKWTGHVFDEDKEFGYKKFQNQKDLLAAIGVLYKEKLTPLIEKGLCGCIYTQVSDVEEEINGLVTYDRKIIKIPIMDMRKINDYVMDAANKIE